MADVTNFNSLYPFDWFWIDHNGIIHSLSESISIKLEKEFHCHIAKIRLGQLVFHCFGNGMSAIVCYDRMETECGSGKCRECMKEPSCNHMNFKLVRKPKQIAEYEELKKKVYDLEADKILLQSQLDHIQGYNMIADYQK